MPHDLSIVGWDDVPYASLVTPPLTTVRVPRYELGQAAARRLLDLMAGRPGAGTETPLALELVRRESCAPPGGRPSRVHDVRSGARGARARAVFEPAVMIARPEPALVPEGERGDP